MSGTTSGARAGKLYREYLAVHLRGAGLSNAAARETQARRPTKLSDALSEAHDGPHGDIVGIPGWSVVGSFRSPMNISRALDQARIAALLDGNPWYAAVVARPGISPADSYVITTLDALAELARS